MQYVDDICIVSKTEAESRQHAIIVLNFLADKGYKTSQKKAQISLPIVKYMGFELSQGLKTSSQTGRGCHRVAVPTTRKQLPGFPGMAGFCRIWIPSFGLIAKPLYAALTGQEKEPLPWTGECQKAFLTIKEKLMTASALGLPHLCKPFDLFIQERDKELHWVLSHCHGKKKRNCTGGINTNFGSS